jgi:ATP phosphoribosyltransferase
VLTIALSKGKLLEPTLELFTRAGYTGEGLSADSRRLVIHCPDTDTTLLIVRPSDVPTYVEYGAADAGVVGKDMLLEQDRDVYEPLDLKFGACRISVAALRGQELRDRLSSKIRVATKYPNVTERYFNEKGIPVEIIKLYGSIELAPSVGLADRIVDLVSTGNTLKAHHLVEIETIAESTARLIVNRASLKMKYSSLTELMARLRGGRPRGQSRTSASRVAKRPGRREMARGPL